MARLASYGSTPVLRLQRTSYMSSKKSSKLVVTLVAIEVRVEKKSHGFDNARRDGTC